MEEKRIHAKMQEEYKRALEVEKEKEMQRWEESVQYQEQLERQLAEKERRKQDAYEEFLKEKLMIDEIVRKIYEEDQRCVHKNCQLMQRRDMEIGEKSVCLLRFTNIRFQGKSLFLFFAFIGGLAANMA